MCNVLARCYDFRAGLEWQRRNDYPSSRSGVLNTESEPCDLFL